MNKEKKAQKKEGSQSKPLSPVTSPRYALNSIFKSSEISLTSSRDIDQGSSVKSTRRKLISVKLKKFLSARPSQDYLYDKKILRYGNPSIPLKLSIFNKIAVAFDNSDGTFQ